MASSAIAARGTTIKIDGVAIGEVRSIKPPNRTVKVIDVTSHDSTYEEFVTGIKSGGEVTLSGLCIVGNAGQVALNAAYEGNTKNTYLITLPTAVTATITFDAYVTAMPWPASLDHDGVADFNITLKVTGTPVIAIGASAGVSALVVTSNAGAITDFTPTPHDAATYEYIYNVLTTESWVKFTATFAAGTCLVYNSAGTLVATLTTTVISGQLDIGDADTITTFTVKQTDPGETTKEYTIHVRRPAP